MWYHYWSLVPGLGRQRQVDVYGFEASLVYIEWLRLGIMHSETVSQHTKNSDNKKKKKGFGWTW